MKIIGLTGSIGSGKSTVAKFLSELGAYVLDADKLGHEAFKPGDAGWSEVVAAFGDTILTPDKQIDRKILGNMVFGKPEELNRLNSIMHPRIFELVKARLETLAKQGAKIVVLEATLLVEAGWENIVDEIWLTIAPEKDILKRLRKRSGYSEVESLIRLRSQSTNEERLKHADIVINTDCALDELRGKIKKLWDDFNAKPDCLA
jgi:dephospho-CoA kinase